MSTYVVQAGWDDVPHLSEQDKTDLGKKLLPHQREARRKGIPSLGSGAIYPVPEEDIVVDPFQIPSHWFMGYGLDVGWNKTAGIWGAHDRDADIVYLFSEHYRGQAEPSVHATSIKARGKWMKGAIDPASRGRSQVDGKKLFTQYRQHGLNIIKADNSVEAGLLAVYERLSTGRLKVFKNLGSWLKEYRIYRRDEDGKIIKKNDHIMDATRYLVMEMPNVMKQRPIENQTYHQNHSPADRRAGY